MTIEREALATAGGPTPGATAVFAGGGWPRQVGKTTLVRQALDGLQQDAQPMAQHSTSAYGPGLQGQVWLSTQWQVARALVLWFWGQQAERAAHGATAAHLVMF